MINVLLHKTIKGSDPLGLEQRGVQRECQLPFPPTKGLSIVFPHSEDDPYYEVIIETDGTEYGWISWDLEKERFTVYLEEKVDSGNVESVAKEHLEFGWHKIDYLWPKEK